ncbi:hypothetical protein [Streptomyces sp. NPDC048142]|uniref:hypothetical protein n=1 Tax=Streptomyces sp. NPDC048142 TaxID=3365501 RepID=UPI0037239CF2
MTTLPPIMSVIPKANIAAVSEPVRCQNRSDSPGVSRVPVSSHGPDLRIGPHCAGGSIHSCHR